MLFKLASFTNDMKILIVSTYDIAGGAARAAYRLHQGLENTGNSSQMLVQENFSGYPNIISPKTNWEKGLAKFGHTLDTIPTKFYPQRKKSEFSTQWNIDFIEKKIAQLKPDIINLHWINESHVKIETLAKLNLPIVWTLHDMWAFTGGCHYDQNCQKYTDSCGACPQLGSSNNFDLSHRIWKRKSKAWKNINLTIVTPSNWLADCAKSSSLFKDLPIHVIPNSVDINRYKPLDRQIIRNILGLPQDKQLILFGAINATSTPRKGFHLLQSAIQNLGKSGWSKKADLMVIGAAKSDNQNDFGLNTHYLGKLNDDISIAQIYAAADVFVAPSTQDNLPNTVMEALACGTPCVAFKIGGMPDMIEHQQNGYLAQPFEVEDLTQGIAWVLDNKEKYQSLCARAHKKAKQEFTQELQALHYSDLYTKILANSN